MAASFPGGTATADLGHARAFPGAFRTLSALAAPGQTHRLLATIHLIFYLAFTIPSPIGGVATSRISLQETALMSSAAIAALVAVIAGILLFRRCASPPG